jgi:pilus assembly protein CpaC
MAALVLWIIVILVAAPYAQQAAFSPSVSSAGTPAAADSPTDIDLLVGRSTIVNVGAAIARVSLTVPDIADAMVTAPSQLLIHGKQPGTISLFVWDRAGSIKTYEVKVRRDLTALTAHMKQLFPGETIEVRGSGKDVVVSGTVSSKYVMEKAGDVAAGYVEKKENVVNLLRQQEGVASNQVMLKVRFAEVSRSALTELGVNLVANGFKNDWYGRTTTQQFASPDFDSDRAGGLVFSDFLNIFVFNAKEGLGGVVRALQNKGLFQSLAEPNLIASNGKEASFLAGGEYPYPVVQGGTGGTGNAVTIMFKEFGVRLTFTPTVIGNDLVHLKVKPEVSALDFANGVVVSGFRVPALSTRRTETEVELQNGQTFAIAGLMNNTLTNSMSKIPGIGDIPILGLLFRSKAHQKNQTELVVMITPTIIRKGSTGVSEGLPSLVEPYLGAPAKTYPNPTPWVGSPRYPANQPAPRTGGTNDAPQPQASAPAQKPAQPATGAPWPGSAPSSTTNGTTTAAAPAPLTSRPIQAPAQPAAAQPAPVQPAVAQPSAPAAPRAQAPAPAPAQPAMTREQLRAIEQSKEDIRRAAAAAEKARVEQERRDAERAQAEARAEGQRRAEEEQRRAALAALEQRQRAAEAAAAAQAKLEQDKKDGDARKLADKLDKERARREAEVARKNAETSRKRAEEDQKREKALADAAARLKEAQAAYQAQLEKAKGGSSEKPKSQKH